MVLCEDNLEYLTLNAECLALAARCLEEFYALADQKGAEVARGKPPEFYPLATTDPNFSDYSVTSWLLARETVERPDGTPLSASGISKYKWKNKTTFSDWDAGVVWLLKPHRLVAVEKWSGTMLHPNRTGKWHTMMSAFAHFSFLFTEKSAVLVDLQSTSFLILHTDHLITYRQLCHTRFIRAAYKWQSRYVWQGTVQHNDPHGGGVCTHVGLVYSKN